QTTKFVHKTGYGWLSRIRPNLKPYPPQSESLSIGSRRTAISDELRKTGKPEFPNPELKKVEFPRLGELKEAELTKGPLTPEEMRNLGAAKKAEELKDGKVPPGPGEAKDAKLPTLEELKKGTPKVIGGLKVKDAKYLLPGTDLDAAIGPLNKIDVALPPLR